MGKKVIDVHLTIYYSSSLLRRYLALSFGDAVEISQEPVVQ